MKATTLITIALAATCALPGGDALANGRMPDSVKLVFRPGQPEHMVLGVTFGVMESTDGGASWRWICEAAVGFNGTYDPDYELTRSGALFATTFKGMTVTRDRCHWQPASPPLGAALVSSIAIGADDTIWAGMTDFVAGSAIYKSTDDGATFLPTAPLGQSGDWWASIEVAPSDPTRIYVTAFRTTAGQPRQRLLFRSRDAGATWEELPTSMFVGTEISDLLIAGIHPTDPDTVFMRLTLTGTSLQERFYRTTNAGTTAVGGPAWQQVLEVNDFVQGFAIRRNGEVWAGATSSGLFRSTDGGQTFAPVPANPPVNPRCLRERPDGVLYACGNNLPPDSAALTRTTDGVTWSPFLSFAALAGPVRCEEGTSQRDDCQAILWCGVAEQLGVTGSDIDCTDAGVDAAGGGANGSGGCCGAGRDTRTPVTLSVVLMALLRYRRRRNASSHSSASLDDCYRARDTRRAGGRLDRRSPYRLITRNATSTPMLSARPTANSVTNMSNRGAAFMVAPTMFHRLYARSTSPCDCSVTQGISPTIDGRKPSR